MTKLLSEDGELRRIKVAAVTLRARGMGGRANVQARPAA